MIKNIFIFPKYKYIFKITYTSLTYIQNKYYDEHDEN